MLGGYRDRVLVELAQNAADAAAASGSPGRLLLRLAGGRLVAANTGAPLHSAGVEALSTLRASAKRASEAVGRFGVGFAAVLAVTDEPSVHRPDAGVAWSAARSRQAAAAIPELAADLASRSGAVPVLRLPFPAAGLDLPGFDTVVVLPLRDGSAEALLRPLLASLDATVLLSLPWLREVVVDLDGQPRSLTSRWVEQDGRRGLGRCEVHDAGVRTTWATVRAQGRHEPAAMADRPVEERARPAWSLLWAVPVLRPGDPAQMADDADPADTATPAVPDPGALPRPAVVRAPTPTDEPLTLPALLWATFPLDPTRRHVAAGPATDAVVAAAGEAYLRLVSALSPGTALVPPPLASGRLDGALHRAIRSGLSSTPFLPSVGEPQVVAPRDAVAAPSLDDATCRLLSDVVPGLLRSDAAADRQALAVLDVPVLRTAEVVDRLAAAARPAQWWHRLYAALTHAGVPLAGLEGLPVPLADGRLVTGPRAVLLPERAHLPAAEVLAPLGLRLADHEAVHPLLERLGARRATAEVLLTQPASRQAVELAWDEPDPEPVVEALLSLVAVARPRAGEHPWLSELPLPDAAGGLSPAGQLMLAGSALAGVVEPGSLGLLDPAFAATHDRAVLLACGVLDTFAVARGQMLLTAEAGEDPQLDVEGLARWAAQTGADAGPVAELVVVRDLDLVAEDRWEAALGLLAAAPLREAVLTPARVILDGGRSADVPSYAAWWLGQHALVAGRLARDLAVPGADPCLLRLYDVATYVENVATYVENVATYVENEATYVESVATSTPVTGTIATGVDPVLLAALGARTTLARLLAEPGGPDEVLDRLARVDADVPAADLGSVYAALAGVDPHDVRPPALLRVPAGAKSRVVAADRVVVADSPHWLALAWPDVIAGPLALAEVLDLPTAADRHTGTVTSTGLRRTVPAVVGQVLTAVPPDWLEHEELTVDGVPVDWWVDGSGAVHACTLDGLASGLAWAAGSWSRRWLLSAVLARPDDASLVLAEDAFG